LQCNTEMCRISCVFRGDGGDGATAFQTNALCPHAGPHPPSCPWRAGTDHRALQHKVRRKNHRTMELLRLEKTSKIIRSVTPAPPCLLNHILKCHIYTFLAPPRDGDSTTALGSLVHAYSGIPWTAPTAGWQCRAITPALSAGLGLPSGRGGRRGPLPRGEGSGSSLV